MLGRRRSSVGMPVNAYSTEAAAAESVYNADVEPPITSYTTALTPLNSRLAVPTVAPKTRGAFVVRGSRRNGLIYNWAWGATDQGTQCRSLPQAEGGLNGFVDSTKFQTDLIQLHDWQTNLGWYSDANTWSGTGSAMFQGSNPVRYTYPSFRVSVISTSTTGAPAQTPQVRMGSKPAFTRVQTIRKYTVNPKRYNTKGQ